MYCRLVHSYSCQSSCVRRSNRSVSLCHLLIMDVTHTYRHWPRKHTGVLCVCVCDRFHLSLVHFRQYMYMANIQHMYIAKTLEIYMNILEIANIVDIQCLFLSMDYLDSVLQWQDSIKFMKGKVYLRLFEYLVFSIKDCYRCVVLNVH